MKTRPHTDHFAAAGKMRAKPGEWVLVCTPKDHYAAMAYVRTIRKGIAKAYRPAGSYEAWFDRDLSGTPRVWARWIGGTK